ncbi:MAG: hypothetical protein DMG33_09270, partial [Acidobacteria bacterium]
MRASSALLVIAVLSQPNFVTETSPKPVAKVELLALVAGGALRENVVHEIEANGLGFRPDDEYRSQLKAAGADATLLAAVNAAKVVAAPPSQPESEKAVLQHMSNAASLMKDKHYTEAANELNEALAVG